MIKDISISNNTRWIAAATGCVTAVTGIPVLSWLSALASGFLIIGALLAGRHPRYARGLVWFGAGVTTFWVIPVGVGILGLSFRGGTDQRVIVAAAASVLLVVLCDATLVKEALDARRTVTTSN